MSTTSENPAAEFTREPAEPPVERSPDNAAEQAVEAVEHPAIGARAGVDRVLVRGIAWTAAGKWLTQLVSWTSTIFVARLLTPSDYGLVGMAALYLGIVALVSEFGIGSAVVTLHDLTDEAISQLNTLSVGIGIAIFLFSCAMAEPLSIFFRTPALIPVVLVLSGSFVVGSLKSVPNALLQREFRFRDIATIDAVRALCSAGLAITLAVLGLRYWSLVLSEVFGVVLATTLTLVWRRQAFRWPRLAAIQTAVTFSRRVLVGRLSWYVYSNSDFMVAGRVLGQAALGAYDFAWTLTNIPVEKLTSLVSNVTPAVFASVQHDDGALKRSVLALTEGIAIVAFPISIGLALVSGDFIHGVFGDKWDGAIMPLRLLAIYTALRSVMPIIPTALTVRGKTRFLMLHGVVSAVVFPLSFLLGSRWGTVGIAGVWVALYPLSCVPLLYMSSRYVAPAREYFGSLKSATLATIIMAAVVFAVGATVPHTVPALARVATQVVAGVAAYAGTMLLIFPERIAAFRRTIAGAL